jgi:hypothetical protein
MELVSLIFDGVKAAITSAAFEITNSHEKLVASYVHNSTTYTLVN